MNDEKYKNRRYNRCTLRKTKSKNIMENDDEVATKYKLQQFLKDVQKFNERSKKTKTKQNLNRKPADKPKQIFLKRGLFENGLKSRPCVKENRARLKSNLNDLIKECPQLVEDEIETISSIDHSSSEGSYELGNLEDNGICAVSHDDQQQPTSEKNDRLITSEKEDKTLNNLAINSNKQNDSDLKEKLLKEMLREKCDEHKEDTKIDSTTFPMNYLDHMEIVRKRINEMIYQTFLKNARNYPTILQRIFSTDEIKKLAQIVVKDKVDKCEQTDNLLDCGSNDYTNAAGTSVKKDDFLPFPISANPCNSRHDQQEKNNFFEMNVPKETKTQTNFLESLENQPDMFSPAVPNISSNCDETTPPPSPLPSDIQRCWAPSTVSTPRKPEILTPNFQLHSPENFNWQVPLMPQYNPLKENRIIKSNMPKLRNRRRKIETKSQYYQNNTPGSSLLMCFPKRKKVTFSPHRL